jgi:hypothetical protein
VNEAECGRSGDANGDLELSLVGRIGDRANRSILVDHQGGPGQYGRTSTRSFAVDDSTVLEELTTPDSPGFGAFERSGETGSTERTSCADRFGAGDVDDVVAEEEWGESAVTVTAAGDGLHDRAGFVENG